MIKKLFFTYLLVFSIILTAYSQYYYIPNFSPGSNPQGLNTDREQPSTITTGWTTIASTSSTPIWSSIVSLPTGFNFLFNGNSVTSYKVSTSGVLTFTTSATTPPTSTNSTIPSALIPDNSILVWGLEALGGNDEIKYKTFGNAPNRQHWIQFNSYSAPGSSGSNWTYWSIVLVENTNMIYIVDQRTYNTPLSLTLGIQINSSNAYQVIGAPITASVVTNGGTNDTPVDNAFYEFFPGLRPQKDAELMNVKVNNFGLINSDDTIKFTIRNKGIDTLKNLIIKYKINNNLSISDTIKNLNLSTNNIKVINHKKIFKYPNIKTIYDVTSWVEYSGDNINQNDSIKQKLNSLTFVPQKRMLVESSRELWVGWSPRSEVRLNELKTKYIDRISAVAIYENTFYYNDIFKSGGFPEAHIDRNINNTDPNDFGSIVEQKKSERIPLDLSITSRPNTIPSLLDITFNVKLATELVGKYKLGVLITEDSIFVGPQYNNYSGGSNGIMGGFETLPNPVQSGSYEYNNYLKGMFGTWNNGYWNLPNILKADSIYKFNINSFHYGDKSVTNPNKMHIIAYVIDSLTGQVINCGELNFNKLINKIESQKSVCKNENTLNIVGNIVSGTYKPKYKWIYSVTDSLNNFNALPGKNNEVNYILPDTLVSKNNLWVRRVVTYSTNSDTSNLFIKKFKDIPTTKLTVNNLNQCLVNNKFDFRDSSFIQNGSIIARLWDFGDGTTSTLQNPSKIFNKSGKYKIKLTVTTSDQCTDTTSIFVNLFDKPKAKIYVLNETQCLIENVYNFIDSSTITIGTITSRMWYFGDGTTSSLINPIKSFSNPGTYNIKLIVVSNNQCIDTSSIYVSVYESPKAKISLVNNTQCLKGNIFNFKDSTSIGSGTTIIRTWHFGDGTTSTFKNPTKSYSKPGIYKVKLTVTTNNQCIDTSSIFVNVYETPKAKISLNNNSQCLSENVFNLKDSTTIASGTITSRIWHFGDGTTSSLINPTKTFSNPGTYNVKLIVVSNNGCIDSTISTVTVRNSPNAGSIAGQNTNVLPNTQYLYNINQQLNHTYEWVIENGAIITGQGTNAITIQWLNNGIGKLNCIITNSNNCTDTAKLELIVGATGIDNKYSNIKIYPNPTSDIIHFEGLTLNEFTLINIYDVQGKLILSREIKEQGVIDISEFNNGIYIIKIGEMAYRIVKM